MEWAVILSPRASHGLEAVAHGDDTDATRLIMAALKRLADHLEHRRVAPLPGSTTTLAVDIFRVECRFQPDRACIVVDRIVRIG